MGRRDEIEPRFGWLTTVGAALGILLLIVVLAVVALDSGDEPRVVAAGRQLETTPGCEPGS